MRIAPSLLSSDIGHLAQEIDQVAAVGADWIHVDVMDGRFVPNFTFGTPIVRAARAATKLPIDVHLMMVEPERYIDDFANAGADIISVHQEACVHLQRTLASIRGRGKRAGVVLSPATPETTLDYVLDDVDLVLVMCVNPGFGGQTFLPSQLPKIERLARRIQSLNLSIDLEVDGGINAMTVRRVVDAGATAVVAGDAVFGQPDRAAALKALRSAAGA